MFGNWISHLSCLQVQILARVLVHRRRACCELPEAVKLYTHLICGSKLSNWSSGSALLEITLLNGASVG